MLWLILGAVFAFQVFLLVGRTVELPGFVCERLRKVVAREGLDLNFKNASFDPSGVIVLDHVSLADRHISADPILTARALLLRVDPGWLITRRSDLRIEATGVSILLPPVVSPTGLAEPLVENAQFSFRLSGHHIDLHGFSARIAGAVVTARGTLNLDSPGIAATPSKQLTGDSLRQLLSDAIPTARRFVTFASQIRTTGDLVVHLALEQRTLILTALMPEAHYQMPSALTLPTPNAINARNTLARVTMPLDPPVAVSGDAANPRLTASLTMESLELAGLGSGTGVAIEATAPIIFSSGAADSRPSAGNVPQAAALSRYPLDQVRINASVDHITSHGAEVRSARLTLRPRMAPVATGGGSSPYLLQAALSSRWLDTSWNIEYDGRMDTLDGTVSTEGMLTPETLDALTQITQKPLNRLLQLSQPAYLLAQAKLTPGNLAGPATGYLHARDVIAGNVPFNLATGHFTWDGARTLVAHDITLQQNDSVARGSYTMDAQTLDFRFLLSGRLRPAAIGGWFGGWWQDFWDDFGFGPIPAAADVDVKGNWRDPYGVYVMVGVSGDDVSLRGVDLDHLHTHIFIRPTWYDILDFYGERAGRSASGRFDLRLHEAGEPWELMNFDVRSTLPLPLASALIGADVATLLSELKFEAPPSLHAAGFIRRPPATAASSKPVSSGSQVNSVADGLSTATYQLTLDADAAGPFTVYEFPLRDLSFKASINNEAIRASSLRLGLASGILEGPATLTGGIGQWRLSIDQKLKEADLAELVLSISQAIQRHSPPPPPVPSAGGKDKKKGAAKDEQAEFAHAVDTRLKGGRLNLRLQGAGPLADVLAFEGEGDANVYDAPLADVSLLWHLSTVLKAAGLGFTSFNFDKGEGQFVIRDRQVRFSKLDFSGPSAEVNTEGAIMMESGRLDFRAKLHPYEKSRGILGAAADWVLSPVSTVLEFQLAGTLMEPEWVFRYGPRGLFRSLTGANRLEPAPARQEAQTPDKPADQ